MSTKRRAGSPPPLPSIDDVLAHESSWREYSDEVAHLLDMAPAVRYKRRVRAELEVLGAGETPAERMCRARKPSEWRDWDDEDALHNEQSDDKCSSCSRDMNCYHGYKGDSYVLRGAPNVLCQRCYAALRDGAALGWNVDRFARAARVPNTTSIQ